MMPTSAPHGPPATTSLRTRGLRALGWMLLASLLFAVMNLLGRVAGTHKIPWPMIAFGRALAGVVVSFAAVRARRAPIVVSGSRAIWVRSGFGTMAMMLTFYVLGSEHIALGDAATLFNLMPIFVALIAPFALGERTGARLAVALPIALAGVVLVVKPPALFGAHGDPTDPMLILACVAAALCASIAMMGLRTVGRNESPEAIALHFSFTAMLVLGVVSIPYFAWPSARDVALIAAGGTAAGIAQIAMTRAYTLERAALVASYGYANVLFTALLAALALRELPDGLAALGMLLVVIAGVAVTFRPRLEEETLDPSPSSAPPAADASSEEKASSR